MSVTRHTGASPALLRHTRLDHFFADAVTQAMSEQNVAAHDDTVRYLTALLCHFSRAERLLEKSADGPQFAPLAHYYGASQTAPTAAERLHALQRLGDIALFIAGLFQASLARKPVDVDYYVSMGGAAYGTLAERVPIERRPEMRRVYAELAEKFISFVDVLATVGEDAHTASDKDLLRIYEVWLRTGSERAARQLRKAGIEPSRHAGSTRQH